MTDHLVCHQNIDKARSEYRQQLDDIRKSKDADGAIGRYVRGLLLPGNKRKWVRREELAQVVQAADRAAGVSSD